MFKKVQERKREHNPFPPPFCFVPFHHFPFTTQRAFWFILITHYPGDFFVLCVSLHWDRSLRMEVLMPASVTLWTVLSNRSLGVERLHVPLGKGRPKLYLPAYKGDETLDALQTQSCDERQIKKHLSLFRPGGAATPYPAERLEGGFFLRGDYRAVTNSSNWRCRKRNNTLSLFGQRT